MSDETSKMFFDGCSPIKPQPRDNWHVPVQSNIPTLSFGSTFDVQTPASWARIAIEKMTNAQAFIIPEAGHGAVAYQPCVADMGVAFIDNPKRRIDDLCARSIKTDWHIASWVSAGKKGPSSRLWTPGGHDSVVSRRTTTSDGHVCAPVMPFWWSEDDRVSHAARADGAVRLIYVCGQCDMGEDIAGQVFAVAARAATRLGEKSHDRN